jgi:CDP-paratose 2-epimerase
VLEAARRRDVGAVVYASTNKVYGENVNALKVNDAGSRYVFDDPAYAEGVPETLSVDHCEHSPYGVSKLTGDLYCQDYARLYGVRTGVFRMSCIYGTRQFGNEDQGWMGHFILRTLRREPLTIYGDGKQVRDALYIEDLVQAYRAFLGSSHPHGVWNAGGGPRHTTSLIELVDLLERETGLRSPVTFGPWRPSDQKVYISDVRALQRDLGWSPKVGILEGVRRFVEWYRSAAIGHGGPA